MIVFKIVHAVHVVTIMIVVDVSVVKIASYANVIGNLKLAVVLNIQSL